MSGWKVNKNEGRRNGKSKSVGKKKRYREKEAIPMLFRYFALLFPRSPCLRAPLALLSMG